MNTSSQQIVFKSAKRNRLPSTCPIESYADGGLEQFLRLSVSLITNEFESNIPALIGR